MPLPRGIRRKEQRIPRAEAQRFLAGRCEGAGPRKDVHDLGVGQLALEAAGFAFPDAAVVAVGTRKLDVDAAQPAGRQGQRAGRGALVLQAADGGGLLQHGDAAHGQRPASTASASSASVWKW